MGSSRLPGKALRGLAGRPMLAHVLERVRYVPGIQSVVLATSDAERDRALSVVASDQNIWTHYGSEWDVLSRVYDAAQLARADAVLRVTADCPFFDPMVGGMVVQDFHLKGVDYVWNDTSSSGFPDGLDAEVFSLEALKLASEQATRREDREHVTPWMRRMLRTHTVQCQSGDFSRYKLSIDRVEDYEYAQDIHRFLMPGIFDLQSTIAACEAISHERGAP